MDFGNGGLSRGNRAYPDAVLNHAQWTAGDDFIQLGVLQLQVTEEGDYTFGVHTDDGFGLRIRGGRVVSVTGNGDPDANDPEAVVHPGTTGDSSTRAVYRLSPGTYRVEFLWYERGGGDHGEIYWAKGSFPNINSAPAWNVWRLVGSNEPLVPIIKPGDIPGPAVVKNAWAQRYVFDVGGQIGSAIVALDALRAAGTPQFTGTVIDTTSTVVNQGPGGLFGANLPYPDDKTAADDFVLLSIAHIVVPQSGEYTFGVRSDDGFGLRVQGGEVIRVSGNGRFDYGSPDSVVHPGTSGNSSTRSVYRLEEGIYRIEFFWFERGGGDYGEIFVAKGNFAGEADTMEWILVGDPAGGKQGTVLGLDASGVTATSSDPGGDPLNNWAEANADLTASEGTPTAYDRLHIGDPNTNGGTLPFPKNTGADDNDFAMRVKGNLVVPTTGTYIVGFNSDDGAYIKIPGQKFTEVLPGSAGDQGAIGPDDTLTCDCLTGNANTFAKITLAAGTYPFEAGMFERGGGAYLTVRGGSDGEIPASLFPPLAKGAAGAFTSPISFALTDQPPKRAERISLSASRTANNLTIQWSPAGGTLETTSSLGGTPTWTAVGTQNPAVVPIGTGSAFYRVRR